MLTNKIIKDGNYVTVIVPFKKEEYELKITQKQLDKIVAEGVTVIGVFNNRGKLQTRGRGVVDGKKIQPMIHGLLGMDAKDIEDMFFLADEDHVPAAPDIEIQEPEEPEIHVPVRYDEPEDGQSEEPVRGVSWNKRKGIYEAKATYPKYKDRRFLGYYKPEHVHHANAAVARWKEEGPEAYDEIMDAYYDLYPDREKYRR